MLKRLTIPSLLIMLSSGAQALTLGQIHVHSFINQPLKATIDLQGVKAGELAALKIKLASRAAFKNAGVDWSAQLEGLSFAVIHSNKGPAIKVTSSKAVVEPFLSFVVDASWANGKMSKDFTLLLDPPLYSGKSADAVVVADVTSVTTAKPAKSSDTKPQQQKASQQQPKSKSSAGPAAQTMTGNSLWQVASKVRPANATMQQTMVAIHEENPESFLRGNMNRLKKGQMLRIPSAQVIEGITASAAVTRVAKHERALRAGRSVRTSKRLSPEIVALATDPASAESPVQQGEKVTPPGSSSGGRLSLDSASDDVNEGAMRGDAATDGINASAGAAGNEENKALRSRVALLEEQLKVAHKLIRMKGELAQLQQLYRQIDTQRSQTDDDQTEITDEQLLLLADADSVAAEKNVAQETDQESSGADDAPVQDEPLVTDDLEQQQIAVETELGKSEDADASQQDIEQQTAAVTSDEAPLGGEKTPAEDAESSLETAQQEQQAESATTESESVAEAHTEIETDTGSETETEAETENIAGAENNITPSTANLHEEVAAGADGKPVPVIRGIENNLLYTAGGVGILGLLLAFLLGRGSKKSSRSETALDERIPLDDNLADASPAGESSAAIQEAERVSTISETDEPREQQPYLQPTGEFEPPETLSIEEPVALDPLQLVKVLMRNGDNTKAQEVLVQAVAADPARMELHMQLIELLHANKDRHAFEAEMNQLETSGLKLESDDWQKIERMHADLLPGGSDSPQAESHKDFAAETIDLDDFAVGNNSDEIVAENRGQSDSDLEEALRDFEMVLEEKNSDDLLSEAGIALDEAAAILDNPVANAMPGAHVVEDLELEEDLVVEKSDATDQGIDAISLDDSFGIDSHISSDFDDVFTASADQHEKQSDTPPPAEEERVATAASEDISITSFDADPSTLKQAELDAKIDLAAAFADMGDLDGAKDILDEVMSEGSERQQLAAQEMLKKYL
ncbi:MAG: FimV/HubP family polar landmark protein [Pseudomonadota bacterium]|nr:FimV/HubP family polar landmark protein [Pseudomonadota bacterium]